MSLIKAILNFFVPRERTLLYTTYDQADFFRTKGCLSSEGIPHRSKINGGMRGLHQRTLYGGKASIQYDLYVRKEDEYRASQVIR